MENNSKKQGSEDRTTPETEGGDFDLQLDDLDDEVVDLVDSVEEDDAASDEPSYDEHDSNYEEELSLEDLDLELEDDEPGLDSIIEILDDEEKSEAGALDGVEPAELSSEEEKATDTTSFDTGDLAAEEDLVTDEALAELFASQEFEVAQLIEESAGTGAEDGEVTPVEQDHGSEGDTPEDLYSDLAVEPEDAGEGLVSDELGPVSEEELPEALVYTLVAGLGDAGGVLVELVEPPRHQTP